MTTRNEALEEITSLARLHNITAADIATALQVSASPQSQQQQGASLVSRLLSYIGGILVFSGICVYVGMFWGDFGSATRVILTLGTGFAALLGGIYACKRDIYPMATTPLFLIAAFFQPGGLFVMLDEYGQGGDPQVAALFVSGTMLFQFAMLFISLKRSFLAFAALVFGGIFVATGMDKLDMDDTLISITLGISYICLSTALAKSVHQRVSNFWYFVGSVCLLFGIWEWLEDTAAEILFLGVAAGLVYLSTVVKSRTLLFVSTIAMICYIGHFSYTYFENSAAWPLGLIVTGGVFFGLGNVAMRISRKYINT